MHSKKTFSWILWAITELNGYPLWATYLLSPIFRKKRIGTLHKIWPGPQRSPSILMIIDSRYYGKIKSNEPPKNTLSGLSIPYIPFHLIKYPFQLIPPTSTI